MELNVDEKSISILQKAARGLTGAKRREFEAEVTVTYLDRNARQAETVLGWGRQTVELGMKELETGIRCESYYRARGNKRTEDKRPDLRNDIVELANRESQADPKFQTPFAYTRITAKGVWEALIEVKSYKREELPTVRTISNVLNRLGYKLRRVVKTKPLKKIKETDAIFENVHRENEKADRDPETLRISVDVKAKLKIGELSRNGKSRELESPKAHDHDTDIKAKLTPSGVLEVAEGQLTTVYGNSAETSDFIVDTLQIWWDDRKHHYSHIKKLCINCDNGPSVQSNRTQFIKRMVEFSQHNELKIHLVYYPPYHSKYNSIERCWGVLENHWNGAILNTIATALNWTQSMKWKGIHPIVHFLDKAYEKGVKLTKDEIAIYHKHCTRSETLPKWDLAIE